MGRKPKYATEEERREARLESKRKSKAKRVKKERETEGNSKAWEPAFIGLDGESFLTGELLPDGTPKQAYMLLLRNDKDAIFNPNGLSTWECLRYLTNDVPKKTALVGYFLNFDFEWILKDITQEQYKDLQHGLTVPLYNGEYQVQWFVGKKLVIHRLYASSRQKPKEERKLAKDYQMVTYQDVQGFFQTSFVKALQKWGFAEDDRLSIITSGKANRGGFEIENLEEVAHYNKMEMDLLEELMLKVYESFKTAYEKTGLKFSVNSQKWAGPGVFANDFLKQTNWVEEHEAPGVELVTRYREDKLDEFGNVPAQDYPFSLAYYGGRIELAGAGKFGSTFNYDINSAYPYAISLLPSWRAEDFKIYGYLGTATGGAKDLLDRRLMGMYKIRFSFPNGWTWYPFPVRSTDEGSPNVFYPRSGVTHVMSAELFAVLDTLSDELKGRISILDAFVLDSTDGYGDALKRLPDDRLCTTAKMTLKMADVRLESKFAGKRVDEGIAGLGDFELSIAEKGLKLILNSLYGKTVQQVGTHKYYNDFASAWITSVCRALLWRAIAPERETQNVLMTMTDGVYSLTPLTFASDRLTIALGDWEESVFDSMETFKPGIYRYQDKKGMHYKVRGFLTPTDDDRERLFDLIGESQTKGVNGFFPSRNFLTRNIALEGWKREPYVRQFYQDTKEIKAELSAKRDPIAGAGWLFPEGQQNSFFPPKRAYAMNHSVGYALGFEVIDPTEEGFDDYLRDYDSRVGLEEYAE